MPLKNSIIVYEYGWLCVDDIYDGVRYTATLHKKLAQYLTQNPGCGYYMVYYNKIRFLNYVGAIQVDGITIEVLPKTDRSGTSKQSWQRVLIEMLHISRLVEAKTTTLADISLRELSVLESYLQIFLAETEKLLHNGLIKKYRNQSGNQKAMKGKLLINQHITQNIVHAERFYVSYQVYDRDNLYNRIIYEALKSIHRLNLSLTTAQWCSKLMLEFPECTELKVSEELFRRISFDRKTIRYESAIDLARIILLNYHPDVRGGDNHILAIMFDMNKLWESYVYAMLLRANQTADRKIGILAQKRQPFWQHGDGWSLGLIPDIILNDREQNIVIDTKWKYKKDTSMEDVRQLYAYGKYFNAKRRCLLYPEKNDTSSLKKSNYYLESNYKENTNDIAEGERCDLMFVDILNSEGHLDKTIGTEILRLALL